MIRKIIILFIWGIGFAFPLAAQELYVYTDPASNVPTNAVGLRLTHELMPGTDLNNRTVGELMFGLHKNLMFRVQGSFADRSGRYKAESVGAYAKYRFLSVDNAQSHFRVAAFGKVSHSGTNRITEELDLGGTHSGWQSGMVFTQLLHKLAVSGTLTYGRSAGHNRETAAWGYSFSSGYLLLPFVYKNYKQPNFNLYFEMLGQTNTETGRSYLDLAPAVQLILNSKTRIDLGYRFEVAGNMASRLAGNIWMARVEFNFFNALAK